MIKLLHTADWHMDAPLGGFHPEQKSALRKAMLSLPGKIADIAIRECCQLCLLAGDIFDGPYTRESYHAVYQALERMKIPVFIAPGNHDYISSSSPWMRELWPGNVHIFKAPVITSKSIPELNCRVYGAGFASMDCPGLMADFHADCQEAYALMVLHGDPTSPSSPYCPVTKTQVQDSGIDYVALGHIHTAGKFSSGAGICAWPGCPMGKGYDETGVKGVLITTLEERPEFRFIPLDLPRFYNETVSAEEGSVDAIFKILPPERTDDFFRIRLVGSGSGLSQTQVSTLMARYPNLQILDETRPVQDVWASAGADSLEGVYFQILKNAMQGQDEQTVQTLELTARISRQILSGEEVLLP